MAVGSLRTVSQINQLSLHPSETSGTLYQQGQPPELLRLLGPPLGAPCSVWRRVRPSGTKDSRGEW